MFLHNVRRIGEEWIVSVVLGHRVRISRSGEGLGYEGGRVCIRVSVSDSIGVSVRISVNIVISFSYIYR